VIHLRILSVAVVLIFVQKLQDTPVMLCQIKKTIVSRLDSLLNKDSDLSRHFTLVLLQNNHTKAAPVPSNHA